LQQGEYQPIRSRNDILAFRRVLGRSELVVALNISAEPRRWLWEGPGRILASMHLDRSGSERLPALLRGNEGLLVKLESR